MSRNPYKTLCAKEGCKNYARDGMRFCHQHLSPLDRERADRMRRLKAETCAAQAEREKALAEMRSAIQPVLDEPRPLLPPLPAGGLGADLSQDPETLLRFTEGALDSCRRAIEWLNQQGDSAEANPVVIADQVARLTAHMIRILRLRHDLEKTWRRESPFGF